MLMVSQSTQVYLDGAGGERLCDVNGCRHGEAGFSPLLSSWSRASGESGSLLRDSRWKALRTEARPSPIGFALIISDRRSSAAMALSVGESLAAVGDPCPAGVGWLIAPWGLAAQGFLPSCFPVRLVMLEAARVGVSGVVGGRISGDGCPRREEGG